MLQHEKLFGTARIAQTSRCTMPTFKGSDHIILLCNGHMCSIPILTEGNVVPVQRLMEQLCAFSEYSEKQGKGQRVASLTALPRDQWANLRGQISNSQQGADLLDRVDRALFVVVLDSVEPSGENDCA